MLQQLILRRFRSAAVTLMLGTAAWLAPAESHAQEILSTKYEYATKIACSMLTPALDGIFAQGTYRTVVNVHNPLDVRISFATKVVLANPLGTEELGFSITPYRLATLQPDAAVAIDCLTVAGFFCPINGVCVDFAFLDGFVVVDSPVELDVVGVYTARHSGQEDEVQTMDVEPVAPRRLIKRIKVRTPESKSDVKERIRYPAPKSPQ